MHRTQHSRAQVLAAAEGIDPLAGAHVPRDCIDREVTPLEVVSHRQLGIRLDAEIGVRVAGVVRLARCDRRLAARRDDLDALRRPPRWPEANAHDAARDSQLVRLRVRTAEREQLLDAVPPHEEVDILGLPSEQLVAQRATDLVELAERQLRHAAPQFRRHRLLDGDGLREVPRLVDVQSAQSRDPVGE